MPGRRPDARMGRDLRAFRDAARMAHGWDPADPPDEPLTWVHVLALAVALVLIAVFLVLFLAMDGGAS